MIALPPPVQAYFDAKNRHDVDGMLAAVTDDATVLDEAVTHRGRPAIRAWMAETTRRYAVTAEPIAADTQDGVLVVSSIVTGDFPGSPATLRYRFTLAGDRIVGLAIG